MGSSTSGTSCSLLVIKGFNEGTDLDGKSVCFTAAVGSHVFISVHLILCFSTGFSRVSTKAKGSLHADQANLLTCCMCRFGIHNFIGINFSNDNLYKDFQDLNFEVALWNLFSTTLFCGFESDHSQN